MPRIKFVTGEKVEMRCFHLRDQHLVQGWLAGRVVGTDARMLAVQFDADVFASPGWRIPDRTLWCAHGSSNIRRLEHSPEA